MESMTVTAALEFDDGAPGARELTKLPIPDDIANELQRAVSSFKMETRV
jgi:hypothetical protein